LRKENLLSTKVFTFVQVTELVVNKLLKKIDPSNGPGVSSIPSKVLKESADELTPIITTFFNRCITTQSMPEEWKLALVTPLFK
jgi:hypothetical protein